MNKKSNYPFKFMHKKRAVHCQSLDPPTNLFGSMPVQILNFRISLRPPDIIKIDTVISLIELAIHNLTKQITKTSSVSLGLPPRASIRLTKVLNLNF